MIGGDEKLTKIHY